MIKKDFIKIAETALSEQAKQITKYKLQPHQIPYGLKKSKDCKISSDVDMWHTTGLTETLGFAVETLCGDIELYRQKQAQYGDTVASYSCGGMIDQTLFKVVATKAACGMGKMRVVFNLGSSCSMTCQISSISIPPR